MTKQNSFTEKDVKIVISGIIDAIWGKGVIASNTPENINNNVIDIVDDVVNSIKSCSKPMVGVDIIYNFLYTAPGSLLEFLPGIAADMIAKGIDEPNHNIIATYVGWIDALRGNRQYKTCIVTAALNNRSRLEIALLDI